MARTKTINYKRVTFSFPAKLLSNLRKNVGQNGMSSYVAGLVKQDLERLEQVEKSAVELVDQLKEARLSRLNAEAKKSDSLSLLREVRYGRKD